MHFLVELITNTKKSDSLFGLGLVLSCFPNLHGGLVDNIGVSHLCLLPIWWVVGEKDKC